MAQLSLHGIAKQFDGTPVLQGIDLDLAEGELLVLVGPSGCGKSTLLRIVAGLAGPDAGEIRMDGERVNEREPRQRDVAMVFQGYALYPHMSVRRNLSFPLRTARVPRAEIDERVQRTATMLGLELLLDRKPAQLSGGQMQRVAVGRALVRDPKLFLFDEPLSNLDAQLRDELRIELRRLHESLGITTLYVTHDQAEAMTLGSRICVMNRGRIEQVGRPREVFDRPRTTFVARFIGSPPMNLVDAHLRAGRLRVGSVDVPADEGVLSCLAEGQGLRVGLRPHDVELDGELEVGVTSVEDLGSRVLFSCQLEGQSVQVSREGGTSLRPGDRVRIGWKADRLHVFDARSGVRLGD